MGERAVEAAYRFKGYSVVVVLNESGFRCGYVGIPKEKGIRKKDLDIMSIPCHGGITYVHDRLAVLPECMDHLWIGFDCCHIFDLPDCEAAKKAFPELAGKIGKAEGIFIAHQDGEIRSADYCEEECRRICFRLEEIRRKKGIECERS